MIFKGSVLVKPFYDLTISLCNENFLRTFFKATWINWFKTSTALSNLFYYINSEHKPSSSTVSKFRKGKSKNRYLSPLSQRQVGSALAYELHTSLSHTPWQSETFLCKQAQSYHSRTFCIPVFSLHDSCRQAQPAPAQWLQSSCTTAGGSCTC